MTSVVPVHLAIAHAAQGAASAWSRAAHGWLAWAVAVLLAFSMVAPRAWDADVMLRAAQVRGPQALAGARALQATLSGLNGRDDMERLAAINQFFNRRIVFATDQEVWGQLDYWASPLEMLGKGRGDCEDFVIGKYFSLLAAGISMSRLRLVYVRATLGGSGGETVAHMVLAYYSTPSAEPLILDNLINEIRPASRRPDLEPVFSFNGEGLWQGVGVQSAGDPVARLSRWRDVLTKAKFEGFQ